MSARYLLFLILLTSCQHVLAFNILAIVSVPLRSHYMSFQPLFRELANRGHNVTVINNYPDEYPPTRLKFIDLGGHGQTAYKMLGLEHYETIDSSYLHLYNIYKHAVHVLGSNGVKHDCETLFTNEDMKANLAKGVKYDVIFVEQFTCDCGLAYAAELYDAPIIGIASHVLLPWAYPRLGIPFDVAADAFYFSNSGPNPSLLQKVETVVINLLSTTVVRWYIQKDLNEVFSRYRPGKYVDLEGIAKERMKMMFSNQHFSLTGARLLAPQMLEVGGMHIGTPLPVSVELETFLSDAKHGAIYVSFGSNLKANTMSKNKLQQFLAAFKNMPYKVIWKWENSSLPAEYDNIYTNSWFPQLDVLCHPKVRAFVSHGGMLSISEAAHCGKPVLAIPFFGDQFSNSAAVRSVGLGKTMFFDRLNAENLEETVRQLMSPEMQDNAQRVSRQWHDRPQPVMDSAIYWTEYVARHGSAAPPSLPSKNNTWFESLLIDVYSVVLGIFLVFGLLLYGILKLLKLIIVKLLRSLFAKKSKKD